MRISPYMRTRGFTLVEILLSMAIFGLVLTAIYSSWTSVLRASKAGSSAAEQAQRSRAAMRLMQDAFVSAQMFNANQAYYAFSAGREGPFSSVSFVSRLPNSFPRGSRFGGLSIRRVTFGVEPSKEGGHQLVARQSPLSMDLDEDEQAYPLVLSKNVRNFDLGFWDQRAGDWVDEWVYTNQLPKLVRISITAGSDRGASAQSVSELQTRIVSIPSVAVPAVLQIPGGAGVGAANVGRTNLGTSLGSPQSQNSSPTQPAESILRYRAPTPITRGNPAGR